MAEETVDVTATGTGSRAPAPARQVPALVLLWCRDEPERVGEVILLLNDLRTSLIAGRASDSSSGPRAALVRQLPGRNETTGDFQSKTISREQLRLTPLSETRLQVTNLGRGTLRKDGMAAQSFVLDPGELLLLERRALFLATTRPLVLRFEALAGLRGHRFGEADAWGLVGESPAAWALRARLAFVGARAAHVLITGASGTGKELVAQALHGLSARRSKALVARNAATIPDSLADAELFGNVKHYPNPGTPERPGLIGSADGASLFLDEFAELPEALQAKLLRVLDRGEYHRLGEGRARVSDFRLLAATNRPLSYLKHDVLARFKIQLEVPDLNARRADIPLLARFLLRRIAAEDPALAGRFFPDGDPAGLPRISAELTAQLVRHPYSTHVRELESLLWKAMARATGGTLHVVDAGAPDSDPPSSAPPSDPPSAAPSAGEWTAAELQACLDKHDGRQEPVWRELGMSSRYVLKRLVKKYDLRVRGRGG